MNLFETLSNFQGSTDATELENIFLDLAPSFLYGGYISVGEKYRIYIKTVEFYFHSEESDGVQDPIVYHRNGKCLEIVPYFPLMTLHAHNSGFDITFESEQRKYRASALIREYEIVDENGRYLKWNTVKGQFDVGSYSYNSQSTYLYYILNGFPLGTCNDIKWVDEDIWRPMTMGIISKPRKNVYKYEIVNGESQPTKERCERKWSFTRTDEV